MTLARTGIAAALIAALALTGCQSVRFHRSSTAAEPLEPAPSGTVTSGQLPPPFRRGGG